MVCSISDVSIPNEVFPSRHRICLLSILISVVPTSCEFWYVIVWLSPSLPYHLSPVVSTMHNDRGCSTTPSHCLSSPDQSDTTGGLRDDARRRRPVGATVCVIGAAAHLKIFPPPQFTTQIGHAHRAIDLWNQTGVFVGRLLFGSLIHRWSWCTCLIGVVSALILAYLRVNPTRFDCFTDDLDVFCVKSTHEP